MDNKPIQLFVPKFRTDECLEQIRECLERGWTGLGFKTIEFEDAWKKYTQLPHAHFVNSATAGLHLAVKLLKAKYGWQDGDEIITTPFTFVSTNHAILYENLKPVFADIDEYLCLDPDSVASRITSKTKAVMFVGLGGQVGRLECIEHLCQDRGLKLILDAAHCAGTYYHNEHVGRNADATVFSFHAVKNLPTADGGMICFADADLDKQAREWSWLGIDKDTYARTNNGGVYKWQYDVPNLGFKYHGNSIMAAIGLVQLEYLDDQNFYRRKIAEDYNYYLYDQPNIKLVWIAPNCISSRHLYQVRVPNRDKVMLAMNQRGIFPGVHYQTNTAYPMYAYGQGTCPNADKASAEVISLPMHLNLTQDDVKRVANALIESVGAI